MLNALGCVLGKLQANRGNERVVLGNAVRSRNDNKDAASCDVMRARKQDQNVVVAGN